MDQWQSYSDSPGAPRRFNGNVPAGQQHPAREYNGASQAQPPAGFTFDQYPGGMAPHSQSLASNPSLTPQMRDGNGDVAMHDAGDPYSGMKYPMRPHHQQHVSGSRAASQQPAQEQSSAAQRYSPMEALSPSSPYNASPQAGQNPYARQSPTKLGSYSSPGTYYTNRSPNQQLPPITPYSSNAEGYPPSATAQLNAVFGNDPKSPRRPVPQSAQGVPGRGAVPVFTKIVSIGDLKPKINAQPAFRRANPEGGFISVSQIPDLSPV